MLLLNTVGGKKYFSLLLNAVGVWKQVLSFFATLKHSNHQIFFWHS